MVKTRRVSDSVYFQGYTNHADLYVTDDDNYVCVKLNLDEMISLRRKITEQIIKMKLNDTAG